MRAQLSSNVRAFPVPRPDRDATIYFFDLADVFKRVCPMSNPERLRLICERHVRSIAGSDLVLFAEHGFYLVVMSVSGPAVTALANYINTSLLMLLFGTDSLSSDQRIVLHHPVDVDELPAMLPELIGTTPTKTFGRLDANWDQHGDDEQEKVGSESYAALARDGTFIEQGVELSFFPVHDLCRKVVSTLFCAPTFAGAVFGHQAFQHLSQAELPYIDRAILLHSLGFARRLTEAGIPMAVGAPVSFETLAWSKSRQIYQWALRAHVANQPQIILKIDDIPPGTPAERIAQAVASLRPFSRHIFVHLPNDHIELGMSGRMGTSGLVLSLQRRAALPEVLADSRYLARMAQAQGAMSCIDHVESDEVLAVVRSGGIRFAGGNVFGGETVRGTVPIGEVRNVLGRVEKAITDHLTRAT